jgi:hypothetical protein
LDTICTSYGTTRLRLTFLILASLEGVSEQGAEENIWTKREEGGQDGEDCIIRGFFIT